MFQGTPAPVPDVMLGQRVDFIPYTPLNAVSLGLKPVVSFDAYTHIILAVLVVSAAGVWTHSCLHHLCLLCAFLVVVHPSLQLLG